MSSFLLIYFSFYYNLTFKANQLKLFTILKNAIALLAKRINNYMPLGKEDIIHKQFAAMVRMYKKMNKLNAVFWSYDASGEYRNKITGALLKSKGLTAGKADYEFRVIKEDNICHHIYIEFKTDIGNQSPNQKAFEATCKAINNIYYIARSVEQGLSILQKEGILK